MRKCDGKSRPALGSRDGFNRPIMGLDNLLGDSQTQAGATGLAGSKGCKKHGKHIRRHSAAVIGDADNQLIQIFSGGERYASAPFDRFKGIFQKI